MLDSSRVVRSALGLLVFLGIVPSLAGAAAAITARLDRLDTAAWRIVTAADPEGAPKFLTTGAPSVDLAALAQHGAQVKGILLQQPLNLNGGMTTVVIDGDGAAALAFWSSSYVAGQAPDLGGAYRLDLTSPVQAPEWRVELQPSPGMAALGMINLSESRNGTVVQPATGSTLVLGPVAAQAYLFIALTSDVGSWSSTHITITSTSVGAAPPAAVAIPTTSPGTSPACAAISDATSGYTATSDDGAQDANMQQLLQEIGALCVPNAPASSSAEPASRAAQPGTPEPAGPGSGPPETLAAGGGGAQSWQSASLAPPPPPDSPQAKRAEAAAQAEVDAVVDAANFADALPSTRRLVLSAGIGILDGSNADTWPPGALRLLPTQLISVAADGHRRPTLSRLTMPQFAQTLQRLGAPLRTDVPPGLAFEQFLAAWVSAAKAHPDAMASRPPLLLAALAKRQDPPVDIGQADYDPSELRFGLLDLNLLFAGIAQLAPAFKNDLPPQAAQPQPNLLARVWGAVSNALSPTAFAASTCANMSANLNQWAGNFGTATMGAAGGDIIASLAGSLDKLLVAAASGGDKVITDKFAAKFAPGFGNLYAAVDIVAKLFGMFELYHLSSATLAVTSANPVHRAPQGAAFNAKPAIVEVKAGVPDDVWAAAQASPHPVLDSLADCARLIGIPAGTGAGDVASQITSWTVSWKLDNNQNDLFDYPGSADKFKLVQPNLGSNKHWFFVTREHDADHPGDMIHDLVTITAKVDMAPPQTVNSAATTLGSALLSALTGNEMGLADTATDALTALWENLDTLDASTTLDVTHHERDAAIWHGWITVWRMNSAEDSAGSQAFAEFVRKGGGSGGTTRRSKLLKRTDRLFIRGAVNQPYLGPDSARLLARDWVSATLSGHSDFSLQTDGSRVHEVTDGEAGGIASTNGVRVDLELANDRFRLVVANPPTVKMTGTATDTLSGTDDGKPYRKQTSFSAAEMSGSPQIEIIGRRDPTTPDRLDGGTSQFDPNTGDTWIYHWHLYRTVKEAQSNAGP